VRLIHDDCLTALAALDPHSLDAVVTDPPYGLAFMGSAWDEFKTPRQYQDWTEAWGRALLPAMKPGAHALVFGGTRTWHRMVTGLEDAGFEVRDCVMWLYGQGFPKSADIGKALDRAAGIEREIVGAYKYPDGSQRATARTHAATYAAPSPGSKHTPITALATRLARKWDGWGTALKPAWEPVAVLRAPLSESGVAANVARWGTGALNIDAARIGMGGERPHIENAGRSDGHMYGKGKEGSRSLGTFTTGRWPPNLAFSHTETCVPRGTARVRGSHDTTGVWGTREGSYSGGYTGRDASKRDRGYTAPDGTEPVEVWDCDAACPVRILDEQAGERSSHDTTGIWTTGKGGATRPIFDGGKKVYGEDERKPGRGDSGSASRFFYVPKASRSERGATNRHPTVKPINLLRWLIRLVTPPRGVVCDPFMGSGTTGMAAALEYRDFLGIERDPKWYGVAEQRLVASRPVREVINAVQR
jgi:DNA modification methylase